MLYYFYIMVYYVAVLYIVREPLHPGRVEELRRAGARLAHHLAAIIIIIIISSSSSMISIIIMIKLLLY